MKKRRKKRSSKSGFISVILILTLTLLISIGGSYGWWDDNIHLRSTITTTDIPQFHKLAGYWKFDEESGTTAYDSSLNYNDGTLKPNEAAGPQWTTGKVNGCLSFDGINDYVGMGDVIDFERTDKYTLIAWIKTTTTATGAIIAKMDVANNYNGYDMILESGSIEAHLINNWAADNAIKVEASTIVNDGFWHHIAVSYDGYSTANGLKIYIDGTPETVSTEKDSLSATTVNSDELRIGSRIGHIPFDGLIDEVKIYSCALTDAEIQADYNAG